MKSLLGGIVGAAVGAVVWFWLETGTPPRDASWAPILVGLLTGLGTRLMAGPISAPPMRGAVTALVAVLAMLGSRQWITYSVQQQAKAMAEKTPLIPDVVEEDFVDDEEVADVEDMVTEEPVAQSNEMEDSPAEGGAGADAVDDRSAAEGSAESDLGPTDLDLPPVARSVPTGPVPKPGLGERPLLIGIYYAVGIILAYFLGKGPVLEKATPAEG